MNGAGNDFVIVDNRDNSHSLSEEQIRRVCERQRGVGADGFLAVEPPQQGADYRMRYYNADGGEAEMCGNGARCFARFVNKLEGNSLTETNFETIAGVIRGEFFNDKVRIQLSTPFDLALDETLAFEDRKRLVHSVNTGVPHAVIFVDDVASVDVGALGATIRHHDHFAPTGTNVNFVQIIEPGSLCIRTFERGVEAETLACGTGMVACSIIHNEISNVSSPIRVRVAGGDTLEVGFDRVSEGAYENVTLLGPAEFTFEGILETI